MTVTLHTQALITTEEAIKYLQDQGYPADGNDLLRLHINGITSMMLQVMARDHMKWVDDDEITEYRDGLGKDSIWLKNAPVRKIVSVTLNPHSDSSVEIAGPTEPATYTDDLWFDPIQGEVHLKSRVFADGSSTSKIIYEAGFLSTDSQYQGLKLIALGALAAKWQRYKNKKQGIDSESRSESSVTYSKSDFNDTEIHEMRRYRRSSFS